MTAKMLRFSAATGIALLVALAGPARADVCVSCTGPDAAYSCVIDGGGIASDDSRAKILCMTELAKSGGHQSCTVSRAVVAPCPGEVRKIAAPGLAAPTLAEPQPAAPAPAAPPPQQAAEPQSAPQPATGEQVTTVPKTTPPKTVQEAVEDGAAGAGEALKKTGAGAADVAKSAGGAMEKAGKAVGDAAKTTWKCLSSFFGDC